MVLVFCNVVSLREWSITPGLTPDVSQGIELAAVIVIREDYTAVKSQN